MSWTIQEMKARHKTEIKELQSKCIHYNKMTHMGRTVCLECGKLLKRVR